MGVCDEEYQAPLQFVNLHESITEYAYHIINVIDNVQVYYNPDGEDDYIENVIIRWKQTRS